MPKIKEILTSYLKDIEISTHLNSYEAMATGAAFNGANFSSLFRARPILLSDGLNFPVNLVIRTLNESRKVFEEEFEDVLEFDVESEENDAEEEKDEWVAPEIKRFYKELRLLKVKERFSTKKKFKFTYNGNLEMVLTYTDFNNTERPYKIIEFPNIQNISEVI